MEGHGGSGLKNGLCPGEELGDGDGIVGDIAQSRLDDGVTDFVDAVLIREEFVGTESVDHHLGIALSLDEDTLAVLEVDDIHAPISDDDSIGSAERLRYPLGEIELHLNEQHGVAGVGQSLVVAAYDLRDIEIDIFLHLAGVVALRELCNLVVLIIRREMEELLEALGTIGMSESAFTGEVAAGIVDATLKSGSRCAVEPPVRCRGAQESVLAGHSLEGSFFGYQLTILNLELGDGQNECLHLLDGEF